MRASNARQERVDRLRLGQVDPGSPGMGGVEAEADRAASGTPRRRGPRRCRRARSRLVPRPKPPPAEFSSTRRAASGPSSTSARMRATPSGQPRDPGFDGGVAVRADVDVHEARLRTPGPRAGPASSSRDGPLVEVRVGLARLMRYEAWIATGRMSGRQPLAERRELVRRSGPPPPRRRVVGEDLDRGRADRVGALDGLRPCRRQGQVGAEPAAVWKHRRIVRCAAPWTTTPCTASRP